MKKYFFLLLLFASASLLSGCEAITDALNLGMTAVITVERNGIPVSGATVERYATRNDCNGSDNEEVTKTTNSKGEVRMSGLQRGETYYFRAFSGSQSSNCTSLPVPDSDEVDGEEVEFSLDL